MSKVKLQAGKTDKPVVAHAMRSYYPLTANWIHTQIAHLKRYRPIVITQTTQNLDAMNNIKRCALQERSRVEYFLNRVIRKPLKLYPSFYRFIRRHKAQIIHAHFGGQGYHMMPLAKAAGLPLITMFYGYDASLTPKQDPVWLTLYPKLFRFGQLFLAEGQHMRKQLMSLGCPAEKITVQHLGVNLGDYRFEPRRLLHNEPLRILIAGRFTEKKGIPYAVEAFFKLAREKANVRLTVIGDSGDDARERKIKEQIMGLVAANQQFADLVEFRGFRPLAELRKAYYEHHVFLSPSVQAETGDNEGGAPVTLIEAAATGMPSISTHHCDIPEVVVDGSSGFLAPERDSEALANYLLEFVSHPALITEMGRAGRKHIEAEYDAQRQTERLEILYDKVVARE